MARRHAPRTRFRSTAILTALIAALSSAFCLLVLVGPAFAQGTPVTATGSPVGTKETSLQRIQRSVAKINAEASTPEGEETVVKRLSAQLGVPPDTLRTEHAAWGLGYGEVAMVHSFAKSSKKPGVTPTQVVEMRRGGMAWEAIGKELGVKVDTVAAKMTKHTAKPKPQHK